MWYDMNSHFDVLSLRTALIKLLKSLIEAALMSAPQSNDGFSLKRFDPLSN